ncbi:MAG: hypothetical protein COB66_03655 [Coxiella sp. (in: Bacteria)]|nr:MAG: hypothetical protein COB66_03655 [Coxiella sp. (in: g-proteobacteria)]
MRLSDQAVQLLRIQALRIRDEALGAWQAGQKGHAMTVLSRAVKIAIATKSTVFSNQFLNEIYLRIDKSDSSAAVTWVHATFNENRTQVPEFFTLQICQNLALNKPTLVSMIINLFPEEGLFRQLLNGVVYLARGDYSEAFNYLEGLAEGDHFFALLPAAEAAIHVGLFNTAESYTNKFYEKCDPETSTNTPSYEHLRKLKSAAVKMADLLQGIASTLLDSHFAAELGSLQNIALFDYDAKPLTGEVIDILKKDIACSLIEKLNRDDFNYLASLEAFGSFISDQPASLLTGVYEAGDDITDLNDCISSHIAQWKLHGQAYQMKACVSPNVVMLP